MTLRDEVRLRHVHEACAKIGEFVAGISREQIATKDVPRLREQVRDLLDTLRDGDE